MEQPGDGATPMSCSVLVVDDQAPFRAAARAVVPGCTDVELAGEATLGRGSDRAGRRRSHPDLVLMDINMGAVDGIEATRQIVAGAPDTFVILVSTYPLDDLPPSARISAGPRRTSTRTSCRRRSCAGCGKQGGDPAWVAG